MQFTALIAFIDASSTAINFSSLFKQHPKMKRRLERTFQPTARALNYVRENLDAFMFEVDASQWISGHIQIGRTLDGDFVVLSVEGFVENQEYGADGAIIVCAPDDHEQLLADLSTKACRAAAKTRKSLSAMLQRN
jgi:hypothetical protein